MRESIRQSLSHLQAGWDVLLIARGPTRTATFAQIDRAITELLQRALLSKSQAHLQTQLGQAESMASQAHQVAPR